MTGHDVLTMACNIMAEASGDSVSSSNFISRAPYILAAFCGEASVIDRRYREAFSLGEQPSFDRTCHDLALLFPLCDRLASTAAMYLAATLILDESPSLSEVFAERCRDSLAAVYDEIPAIVHPIKNAYA